MPRIYSFDPVVTPDAKVLILGSMPVKASLRANEYYAHPRNLFWTFLGELIGAGPELPYEARLDRLTEQGIALWDVLKSCMRESSLDSDIDETTIVPNEIAALLNAHPGIERVFFNGAKADSTYRKNVLPGAASAARDIVYCRLPSTSPANASIPRNEKLRAWRKILSFSNAG